MDVPEDIPSGARGQILWGSSGEKRPAVAGGGRSAGASARRQPIADERAGEGSPAGKARRRRTCRGQPPGNRCRRRSRTACRNRPPVARTKLAGKERGRDQVAPRSREMESWCTQFQPNCPSAINATRLVHFVRYHAAPRSIPLGAPASCRPSHQRRRRKAGRNAGAPSKSRSDKVELGSAGSTETLLQPTPRGKTGLRLKRRLEDLGFQVEVKSAAA